MAKSTTASFAETPSRTNIGHHRNSVHNLKSKPIQARKADGFIVGIPDTDGALSVLAVSGVPTLSGRELWCRRG